MEPWHASNKTLFVSPRRGLAWSWSFKEFMSSQPVIKTKTAPGLSFLHIWQSTCSMRLKPIESGFQHDRDSWVRTLYSLKSVASMASFHNKSKQKDEWIEIQENNEINITTEFVLSFLSFFLFAILLLPQQQKQFGSSSSAELVSAFSNSFLDHNHQFDCMKSAYIQSSL